MTDEQLLRYSRHILLDEIGIDGQERILASHALVIGAGGLGAIMFEGLFSSAQDLVLLGVLPIVLMGALADGFFRMLMALTAPRGVQL